MKIESVKNLNITLLFSAPLNHNLVSQQELFGSFKTDDPKDDLNSFIAAPGIRALIFPNRQKEIIFEANRILINEKTGKSPEDSSVVNDLRVIMEKSFFEKEKIAAYGFNYEIVAIPDGADFQIDDLISEKIAKIGGIKGAGVSIVFGKDDTRQVLKIEPLEGIDQKFNVSLNIHYSKKDLPSFNDLRKDLIFSFKEFVDVIAKI
jgi:hypothetical protein